MFVGCGGDNETKNIAPSIDEPQIDKEAFLTEMKALEKKIETSEGTPEKEDLKKAIISYQDYAAIFPEKEDAPDYLLKASDFALFTNQPQESIKLLTRIQEEYPNYARMEDVMYNKASHLDFELRDTTAAKAAYQKFIDTYPNSDLVDDAENRIENIKYSLEELSEKFLKDLEENGNLP